MRPIRWHAKRAGELYTVGHRYTLEEWDEPTEKSRKHYYACVRKGYENLPERPAEYFTSPSHLRKYALIRTGFHHHSQHVFDSHKDAKVMAIVAKRIDAYCITKVTGPVVDIFTAKSQRGSAMKRHEFYESKQTVLEWIAELIGITVSELTTNTSVER